VDWTPTVIRLVPLALIRPKIAFRHQKGVRKEAVKEIEHFELFLMTMC
jgi:hypothetical protein